MKKLLLFVAMALTFFVSMPAMANILTKSHQTDQTEVFSVACGYVSSETVMPDINCSACSKLNINITSYSKPKSLPSLYRHNDDRLVALLTSEKQADPYAIVTSA